MDDLVGAADGVEDVAAGMVLWPPNAEPWVPAVAVVPPNAEPWVPVVPPNVDPAALEVPPNVELWVLGVAPPNAEPWLVPVPPNAEPWLVLVPPNAEPWVPLVLPNNEPCVCPAAVPKVDCEELPWEAKLNPVEAWAVLLPPNTDCPVVPPAPPNVDWAAPEVAPNIVWPPVELENMACPVAVAVPPNADCPVELAVPPNADCVVVVPNMDCPDEVPNGDGATDVAAPNEDDVAAGLPNRPVAGWLKPPVDWPVGWEEFPNSPVDVPDCPPPNVLPPEVPNLEAWKGPEAAVAPPNALPPPVWLPNTDPAGCEAPPKPPLPKRPATERGENIRYTCIYTGFFS